MSLNALIILSLFNCIAHYAFEKDRQKEVMQDVIKLPDDTPAHAV